MYVQNNWDAVAGQWIGSRKSEIIYGEDGNSTSIADYQWDKTTNKWIILFGEDYTYNYLHPYESLILPFTGDDQTFHHMLTSLTYQSNYEDERYMEKASLYYSAINITGIADHQLAKTMVYPNPATENITFSWKENTPCLNLVIYDAKGKVAVQKTISNKERIPVSQLLSGLYIYRLSDENKTISTGKISIK